MIQDSVLTTDDLMRATGYDREGDLKRMFDQQGIRWFPGKGGRPWTTIALINQAGGLSAAANQESRPLGPEDV